MVYNKTNFNGGNGEYPRTAQHSSVPSSWDHIINVNRDLECVTDWSQELQILRMAGPDDKVHVYINCLGGTLDVANEICNAMDNCQAFITTEIVGSCVSAATFIFLKGDSMIVNGNIQMMFHAATHGYVGPDKHVYDYAVFTTSYLENLMRDSYKGFLTDQEIEEVINGKELWLNSEEAKERVKGLIKDTPAGIKLTKEGVNKMTKKDLVSILFSHPDLDSITIPDYSRVKEGL